jgi:ABC-type dipeptide/oligopeptide/nickel transport system permease subunit
MIAVIRGLATALGVGMVLAGAAALIAPAHELHEALDQLRAGTAIAACALGALMLLLRGPISRLGAASRPTAAATVVLLLLTALAVSGPSLVPAGALNVDLSLSRAAPSADHLLGTDAQGRDRLAAIALSAPVTLAVALCTALVAATLGGLIGLTGGWLGRGVDLAGRLLTDTLLATPSLVFQILIVTAFQPEGFTRLAYLVLALSATGWMGAARLVRAEVQALRGAGWVQAARILGLSELTIVRRHVLPHVLPLLGAWTAAAAANAMLAEAALSWLGLGVQLPLLSWGRMVQDMRGSTATSLDALPALLIAATALAFAVLADGLAGTKRTAPNS